MPINEKPFLHYVFEYLNKKGVKQILLCTGFGHQIVKEQIGTDYKNLEIQYSQEKTRLGTGGAVTKALEWMQDEWILILNGDSFCFFDLNAKQLALKNMPLIFVHEVPDVSRFGEVILKQNNIVYSFKEKNSVHRPGFINAGIYWLHRSIFEGFSQNSYSSMEREILPSLLGRLTAVICNRGFIDIGTPDSYKKAEDFFRLKCNKQYT